MARLQCRAYMYFSAFIKSKVRNFGEIVQFGSEAAGSVAAHLNSCTNAGQ